MWTCEKCNREFKAQNQSHYCTDKPKTIDEYIAMYDLDTRLVLESVRNKIREVIPEAEERMSWSMPTFWYKKNIIHFAAHKKHLGIYPGPQAIEHFAESLSSYKTSKGAIQIPYNEAIPLDLIQRITLWNMNN